ncbi:MAG: DNA cytosine methyltransferase [Acidimicrobiaceae bacterium]|nr:DNA cytosine methyltransferase [Acidimicrobiaceae bacterium]MYE97601.1 DNA cytosine methyltransferase [Acidimicrobiaceae bacterium]MYI53324.1 DNA cytosine methyltransferase [Acidimicrobiaceae bacterium]
MEDMDDRPLRVVDLFAGCGGFSTGFVMAGGFDIVAGNDIDDDCLAAFSFNHPGALCWSGSISDLDADRLLDNLSLARGELEVLIGGPPCQGFSRNRARRHQNGRFVDDPRNYLFVEFLRFVEAFLPRTLVVENVADMIIKEGGRFKDEILDSLDSFGYTTCNAAILNAADFGVPQRRRRAFIIASRDVPVGLPSPSHSGEAQNGALIPLASWRTIGDAISDLPSIDGGQGTSPGPYARSPQNDYQELLRGDATIVSEHVAWRLSRVQSDRLNFLQQGDGVEALPSSLVPKSTYGSAYRRMSWDIPALTITTWMYHPGSGMFYHPEDHRTITIREGARLQSFPDSSEFVGGKVSRCRQVGNAVPPLMGAAIAKTIYSTLRGMHLDQTV